MRANPSVDLAVHNEGESTFLKLLESYPDRDAWASVARRQHGRSPTAPSCAIRTPTACAISTRSRRRSSKARSTRS